MDKKFLTMTMIFNGTNLNYGESDNNTARLKRLTIDGKTHVYCSQSAMKYSIRKEMEILDSNSLAKIVAVGSKKSIEKPNKDVKDKNKILQYDLSDTNNVELDFFGYMNTEEKKQRTGPVKVENAISLNEYNDGICFGANIGLVERARKQGIEAQPNPTQREIYSGKFYYTVNIDLELVSENMDKEEKKRRIFLLLDSIKNASRIVAGQTSSLTPLFILAEYNATKNPVYLNAIKGEDNNLNIERIKQFINKDTLIGYTKTEFDNDKEIIKELKPISVNEVFSKLKKEYEKITM